MIIPPTWPPRCAGICLHGRRRTHDPTRWHGRGRRGCVYNYQYPPDNPARQRRELWFHEQGDRPWLVVTRDTVTHDTHRSNWPAIALLAKGVRLVRQSFKYHRLRHGR